MLAADAPVKLYKSPTSLGDLLLLSDTANIGESWSFPGRISDAASVVDGWDPACRAIIEKAPFCVDWKLVYREPLPKWISKGARLALIGDAAHPFLP